MSRVRALVTSLALCALFAEHASIARAAGMSMSAPAARASAYAHHPVSTTSTAAQVAFDRGLTLMYAFNRHAARGAFEQAAKADPHLVMAYWGIALSYGPNINVPID